jgi:hypothetical protein
MKKRKDFIKKTPNAIIVGLHVKLVEEHGYFVAYCPALELSSYGKERETAKKRFEEEVAIFLTETERKGSLEKYLLKMGWTLKNKPIPQYTPPEIDIDEHNSFTEKISIPVC